MKSRPLALAAAFALLLTGCASSEEPESAPPSPVESTTPSPSPDPSPSETEEPPSIDRGFIAKEIGEEGGLTDESTGELMLTLTLTEIKPDYECFEDIPSQNGEFVGLRFDVSVQPGFTADWYGWPSFDLPYSWFQAFTDDGTRVNDAIGHGSSCADYSDRFPESLGPGQRGNGWIVLDVPEDATNVAFVLDGGAGDGLGWEWQIPRDR